MKRVALLGCGLLLGTCAIAGCTTTPAPPPAQVAATTGLYAPGSPLGTVPGAGTPDGGYYDTVNERGPKGDGCLGMFGPPGTKGELVVAFSTFVIGGGWQPANVGAVWIEWVDPAAPADITKERFVRTVEKWSNWRTESLETWVNRRCEFPKSPDNPDAVSTATLPDHSTPHMATWDTRDVNGDVVPDGAYRLYIEVTEFEEQGPIASYEFIKGPMPFMQSEPDGENNTGLTLTYTPEPPKK